MIEIEINKNNLEQFLDNIRDEDKKELIYFLGKDYRNIFIKTVLDNIDTTYFLALNNIPAAIGGILKDKLGAQVWLLCSKKYDRKFLLKYIKEKINLFKNENNFLYNCIYRVNFKALKWLKRFNFKVIPLGNNIKFFYYKKGGSLDIRHFARKFAQRQ
ncbi:hypothetical protein IJ531_05075 [bacterium]|nr:hypothetical protein [bacterium]